jgi:hypothetical protein
VDALSGRLDLAAVFSDDQVVLVELKGARNRLRKSVPAG